MISCIFNYLDKLYSITQPQPQEYKSQFKRNHTNQRWARSLVSLARSLTRSFFFARSRSLRERKMFSLARSERKKSIAHSLRAIFIFRSLTRSLVRSLIIFSGGQGEKLLFISHMGRVTVTS